MAEAPARGRIVGGRHVLAVRVYYEDTDAGGIVYYANYLKYAERARTEMLRLAGVDQARLASEAGVVFAVRRCTADYRRPARLDDALTVETRLGATGAARIALVQSVRRGPETLVDLDVELACLDRGLRPVRLPAAVRRGLTALAVSGGGSGAGPAQAEGGPADRAVADP